MKNLLSQLDLNAIQNKVQLDPSAPIKLNANPTIGQIIAAIIPWIFTIAGMLLLIYLIFGGLQFMVSRGDPKNAQAAKNHITNALIGFIIIFFAYWIVVLLGLILGLQGIGTVFK